MGLMDDKLSDFISYFEKSPHVSFGSEFLYNLKKYEEYRRALLDRSPFKVGDVVVLKETPVIDDKNSPGWIGFKHFLKQGFRAEVKEIDFYEGKYLYNLEFEADSWVDRDGTQHFRKKKDRGHFMFSERWVILEESK